MILFSINSHFITYILHVMAIDLQRWFLTVKNTDSFFRQRWDLWQSGSCMITDLLEWSWKNAIKRVLVEERFKMNWQHCRHRCSHLHASYYMESIGTRGRFSTILWLTIKDSKRYRADVLLEEKIRNTKKKARKNWQRHSCRLSYSEDKAKANGTIIKVSFWKQEYIKTAEAGDLKKI